MNANVRGIGAGNRQIGLSVASLLPHSILPGYGLRYAKLLAWASGYNGLQLLPFWTYSENDLKDLKDEYQVLAYEGSWNRMYFDPRTTWNRIRQLDPGILLDTALFGTERHVRDILDSCLKLFPEAVRIDIDPYGVREVSPHHNMSREEWVEYRGGVAFDAYHVFELPFIDSEMSALNFFLDLLSEDRVEIVHIQFRSAEKLLMFLSGRDEEWQKSIAFENLVLSALSKASTDIPVILEIHPKLLPLGRDSRIRLLYSAKERMRFFLEGRG